VKQLIDFIPLIIFFIVFKLPVREFELFGVNFILGGIFSATAVLLLSSIIVYGLIFIKQRKLENGQWITLIGCLIFGSLTLFFHNETFLKFKAPAISLIFASIFTASHFIGSKPLIQRMLEKPLSEVNLPKSVWVKLNIYWIIFFIVSGSANLFVAFTFESIWVDFKVFGSLAMTLIFLVMQSIYLYPYLKPQTKEQ